MNAAPSNYPVKSVHWYKNPIKQEEKMPIKTAKIEVEIDLFNIPEIQEILVEHEEFVESVRGLRTMENHYKHQRDEFNLESMLIAQREVDELLKKYPKKGWKK